MGLDYIQYRVSLATEFEADPDAAIPVFCRIDKDDTGFFQAPWNASRFTSLHPRHIIVLSARCWHETKKTI
jgi:hypothetical protein